MAEVIENLLTRHLNEDGIVDVASKDDITAQLNQIGIQRGMLVLVDCDYTIGYALIHTAVFRSCLSWQ